MTTISSFQLSLAFGSVADLILIRPMTRVITAVLATACVTAVAETKPQDEKYILRAKVLESHIISPAYLEPMPASVIRVDFDTRFAVTMRVVSIRPPLATFAKNG